MSFQAKLYRPYNGSFIVTIDGKPYSVDQSHRNYDRLLQAFDSDNSDLFLSALEDNTIAEAEDCDTKITVDGDQLMYEGEPVHHVVAEFISDLRDEGRDYLYLLRFLENLLENPSYNSRQQLYKFMEYRSLPITSDGHFLAYKAVRSDWYSKTAGKLTLLQGRANTQGLIYNGIGETIECPRHEVDDNPHADCSQGLHAGAWSYSGPKGWFKETTDRIVIVKINPRDAVSVPHEGTDKLRCCKYTVVSEYKEKLADTYAEESYPDYSHITKAFHNKQVTYDDLFKGDSVSFIHNYQEVTGYVVNKKNGSLTVQLTTKYETYAGSQLFKGHLVAFKVDTIKDLERN